MSLDGEVLAESVANERAIDTAEYCITNSGQRYEIHSTEWVTQIVKCTEAGNEVLYSTPWGAVLARLLYYLVIATVIITIYCKYKEQRNKKTGPCFEK